MKISDCMKRNVVSITVSANISQAAELFAARHIGTLPVVDDTGRLVGLLQLRDLLALVLPDFVRLVEDFDFVRDFGAVETRQPDPALLAQSVKTIMQPPITVDATSGLLRAFATMRKHDLHDLPIITPEGQLVGIASRVDIGAMLLSIWKAPSAGGGR